jgi:hypothetical protein
MERSGLVRHRKIGPLRSEVGYKRTFWPSSPMSALPPKADIRRYGLNVRFVPKADMRSSPAVCQSIERAQKLLKDQ